MSPNANRKKSLKPLTTLLAGALTAGLLSACGSSSSSSGTSSSASDGTTSAVTTAVVSGTVSGGGNSNVAANTIKERHQSASIMDLILPAAHAATWSCTGNGFGAAATYTGPGSFTYTPLSCTVDYRNGKSASDSWNNTFTFVYGASCTTTGTKADFLPKNQPSGCTVTRESAASGTARTLTGPEGNAYTVNHDTTGTNTGFDSTDYPTTDAGVIRDCTAANCATSTLTISGSHLTGTYTPEGGSAKTYWDHTVSTGSGGLTITGTGTSAKVTNGTVIVQHNLAKYTAQTTFNNVTYGDANCCFPTSGSISSTFSGGPFSGQTETLTYSSTCGEATLTNTAGTQSTLTLIHCL